MVNDDIIRLSSRMRSAGIETDRLAYVVEEAEWQELLRYLESMSAHPGLDLTYATSIEFYGMKVCKQSALDWCAVHGADPLAIVDRAANELVAASHVASAFRQPGLVLDALAGTGGAPLCPRPFNGRPDDFTQAQCVAASECGCSAQNGSAATGRDER